MTKLFKYQRIGVKKIRRFAGRALVGDEMGLGKAQPLEAKILTPRGWSTMKEIKVGDEVIGSDGKPTKVIGVFPQGRKKVFRVTFRDGSSTECCDEHLWAVWNPCSRMNGYPAKILPLSTIRKKLTLGNGNARYQIPMVRAVEFTPRPTNLDPYLLGCLLGDGSIIRTADITTADPEIAGAMAFLAPQGTKFVPIKNCKRGEAWGYRFIRSENSYENPLVAELKRLKLLGKKSHEKFIPKSFRFNTRATRIGILQGLMDTDGYVSKSGTLQYSSVSKRLADNLREIIWSLGGTCTLRQKQTFYRNEAGEKVYGKICYELTMALPEGITPFRLPRKLLRYKGRPKYQPCRAIKSVEYTGERLCKCIRVAAPDHLYITDDYVVTHNSLQALKFADEENAYPVLIICKASLKYNWQKECKKHLSIRADVFDSTKPPPWSNFVKHKIAIINYDILPHWYKYIRKMKRRLHIKTVIIDECKNIKSETSIRNKYVRKVVRGIPNVLMLDGTPLDNGRPIELWPAVSILRPDIFDSRFTFGMTYCDGTNRNGKWDFSGASNQLQLNQLLLESCMIRRRKVDVLKDLPEQSRHVIPLEITNRKEYRKADSDFYGWMAQFGKKKLMGAIRAAAFVKSGYLLRLAAELKLPAIIEWIDSWLDETDQKLIVFGLHKKILRPLRERYKDLSVFVDGSVVAKKRQYAIDEFNNKRKKRLAIGQLKAFSEGWSATACSTVCHVEMSWVPGLHLQGDNRVHGIGRGIKGQGSQAFYLVAHDTIEERLCSMLQRKQKNISAVLDGDEDVEKFDIFDQLMDQIREPI